MDIFISLPAQQLELYTGSLLLRHYDVSTSARGCGEQINSFRTPRGKHIVRAKIGSGLPANTVFVRRRPTGETWTSALTDQFPGRDWVLTRILWLSGVERGFNRLGPVDTMHRYIYIHGSPNSTPMGLPDSSGCVRMRNEDIIDLFDLVPAYTRVNVGDYQVKSGDWTSMRDLARPVRYQVFVVEQNVPLEMEWDDFDPVSRHVLALDADGNVIGTARLLPDGHIGRMAVLSEWRNRGVGAALLRRLVALAASIGMTQIVLRAQTHAVPFYERFGFVGVGSEFFEAGIPHITMTQYLAA